MIIIPRQILWYCDVRCKAKTPFYLANPEEVRRCDLNDCKAIYNCLECGDCFIVAREFWKYLDALRVVVKKND